MAIVRIERVPVGVAGLGLLGFDHLQLVYQSDEFNPGSAQETWYVLEGLRVTGLGATPVLGVEGFDGHTTLSEANGNRTGVALAAAIGTAATRGSRILGFADAAGAWGLMASFGREIALQNLPYYATSFEFSPLPTINSNSVIASLLYYAGVDISTAWPRGVRFTPGWTTLIGTRASEHMVMDLNFDTLVAGEGNDTLEGSGDSRTDKMYGGAGDDTFKWSLGTNYIHGGQPQLAYADDGLDTVDYSGAGRVVISGNPDFIPDKTPTYTAKFNGGTDFLFSIERIIWNVGSDDIVIGPGASVFDQGLILDLGQQGNAGHGDSTDFSALGNGLLIEGTAAPDEMIVRVAGSDGEKGLWLESPEWIVASSGDDLVYTTPFLRGVDAGAGNDLIDARAATPFAHNSPNGYDIEIDGGAGDDTIVANAGLTFAHGGAGADRFVLSALSSTAGEVQFTIDDADATDHLYVPYALFDGTHGTFDGSPLMPLLGGIGTYQEMVDFGFDSVFEWRLENQLYFGSDLTDGVFRFIGDISYNLSGADLVVTLYGGHTTTINTPTGPKTATALEAATMTEIIIKNYAPGDLGLTFYDPGIPTTLVTPQGVFPHYPFQDAEVQALTNNGVLTAPLDPAPQAPGLRPDLERQQIAVRAPIEGTDNPDTITLSDAGTANGGSGDDSITGSSGNDILNGGVGSDTLSGGSGNDTYVVDSTGDVVLEAALSGRDWVTASIDYALTANVENLSLTDTALSGTGNALANTILGNDLDNTLSGLDGDDYLAGNSGNDLVIGGNGSDTYAYVIGDGRDSIVDLGPASDIDTLALTGIDPAHIAIYRLTANPGALVLSFEDGGSVTLQGQLSGGGIERVTFDAAPDWTRAELDALAATAPILSVAPPTAVDDPYLATAQSSLTVAAAALTANDVSPSGSPLTIVAVNATSGTATLRSDGDIDVSGPAGGGDAVFTYTVSDGLGGLSTANATIAFIPNAAPVVTTSVADRPVTIGTPLSFTLPASLFSDADNDPLTLTATLAGGGALPGWLTFDPATGTFTGTPPAGASGTLEIVVTASDGFAATATGFRILIGGAANTPPVANAESFTVSAGASLSLAPASLLANDSDADNDPLQIVSVSGTGAHGTVALQQDGSVLYTPDAGFSGTDTFSYTISDGRGGTATAIDTVSVQSVAGVALTGTTGADTLAGGAGDDTINGGRGNDVLSGADGNDLFLVSGTNNGNDAYDGGSGIDTIRGSAGNDVIGLVSLIGIEVIDGGAGNDTIRGTSGNELIDLSATTLIGIELISGQGGADTIIGSAGNDVIQGGTGNDSLAGGAGDDTFLLQAGSNGLDAFDGGAGFDVIFGTSGNDILGLANGSAGLAGIELIDGAGGLDTMRGTSGSDLVDLSALTLAGNWTIQGLGGNDTIIGTSASDTIQGGTGNDVLAGGAGNDTFLLQAGSNGSDAFDGGAGFDVILGTAGNEVLGLANGSASLAGIESIDLGAGSDTLRGSAGDDYLDLSAMILAGVELIDGSGGNDTIIGSAADDILKGGAGNDVFVIRPGGGHDTITDYKLGTNAAPIVDLIDVSAFQFGSFAALSSHFALSASGTDTLITLDASTSLTLTGVVPTQLKANDFAL